MNVFWMTLCTCIVILVSMDWSLQSMNRDHQRSKVFQIYYQEKLKRSFVQQKQYYGHLKRQWASLEVKSTSIKSVKADLVPVQELEEAQLEAGEKEVALYRFASYPLHARFPLSVKHFQEEDSKSVHWKEAWWRLLDKLYGAEDFYRDWRLQTDPESFVKELVDEISRLSQDWTGTGTWGLLYLSFENSYDQRVWQQMLKGSDRSGFSYPSLLTYVWAVDLTSKNSRTSSRLNLPTASVELIAALLGEEFAIEWKRKVDEEIAERMHQIGHKTPGTGPFLLDNPTYKELLEKLKPMASLASNQIGHFVDTSVGGWPPSAEYLIKDGCWGYLANTLEMRNKPKG